MTIGWVDHGGMIRAHDADKQLAVMPEHTGRCGTDLALPQDTACRDLDRHQTVGFIAD